ncbi:MAG TPA: DUF502 domain-containing protein [Dissulfurispiraceae bacterium]|nr:DUF502 domain-containing protein [Dissulfurispiraceae bacterium]
MVDSIRTTIRRKFLTGLIITIPGVITLFVILTLFKFIDGLLGPFIDLFLGKHVAGLGFVAVIAVIFLTGILSTNVFGQRLVRIVETLFLSMPVVKSVYTAVKQLLDAFSPHNKSSFRRFVIVEYPRPGAYAFGFLTKECVIHSCSAEIPLKAVYVPTNNLYLGEVVLLEDKNITYTDIPIDEGIRIILSGGTAAPPTIMESMRSDPDQASRVLFDKVTG